ncbi:MAG: 1,4-dihydroxy-2-naphthoate polyprenyltransferase, partial [Clostridia bacterium]|nr:1,4-dihydroxy-2-naphthoate polyprenyltransferase [Clostridia bacterium]
APVVVGAALAYKDLAFSLVITIACLVLATLLQIGSNYANDLFDYKKGTDRADRVGPKRAVASGLITPTQMLIGTIAVLLAALLVGLYLTYIGGIIFFVIGIFCIAAAVMYTAGPFALAYNGLGDVAVFIFFGLVAVVGTYYLQAKEITFFVVIAAIGVGALAANILVVNNTRDRHTDARTGKKTLAVRFGHGFCIYQYIFLLVVGYLCALMLMLENIWAFLPLFTIPMAIKRVKELQEHEGTQLNPTLGKTANLLFFYSALLGIGLIL